MTRVESVISQRGDGSSQKETETNSEARGCFKEEQGGGVAKSDAESTFKQFDSTRRRITTNDHGP